jgi:hypothetical protein
VTLGLARRRQRTRRPGRADDLAEIVLEDWRGERTRLGDLWRDGPVVLVFMRHYG